ncbi:hypothetical protein K8O68_05855 [Salipaludibacillus sp. CUR1]|uniref:hypothetical protein n=1 Tax=Salipaludibacillus sp. CUR1 TaxID=2820003 RepID=UPI001E521164|nr:hypothetical protein [Salipaludibacillus sp. CUR1]MCE7791943.1 hypothetical protein [Salipaludibacillus sp. CUR1]
MKLRIKKADQDDVDKIIIVSSAILLTLSFFAPVVLIQFVQEILHFSYDHWLFTAPRRAFQTVMGAMILLPALAVAYFIVRHMLYKKNSSFKAGGIFLAGALFSLPMVLAGLNHYYYFDDTGLHYNSLSSINETVYSWDDISAIEPVSINNGGRLTFQYIFIFKTGDEVIIEGTDDFLRYREKIYERVKDNGGDILERREISG